MVRHIVKTIEAKIDDSETDFLIDIEDKCDDLINKNSNNTIVSVNIIPDVRNIAGGLTHNYSKAYITYYNETN